MIAAEPFGPLAHALEHKLDGARERGGAAPSVAFSIASPYGTYQGLAALRDSGGLGVPITDEGIFEAQRALASGPNGSAAIMRGTSFTRPQRLQLHPAFPDTVEPVAVRARHHDHVGRGPPEVLGDLPRDRLVALDANGLEPIGGITNPLVGYQPSRSMPSRISCQRDSDVGHATTAAP